MNSTRRDFLQASLSFGLLLSLPPFIRSAVHTAQGGGTGFLFDEADLPWLRATLARPEFAAEWKKMQDTDFAAEEKYLRTEFLLNEPVAGLLRVANILLSAAFVYLLEKDLRQLALARLAFERIMACKRWDWILDAEGNTVGVMRNTSTIIPLILASEWLGEKLTPAEQAALRDRIIHEAGPASYRAVQGMNNPTTTHGWVMDPEAVIANRVSVEEWPSILDRTNLRIIATTGLAAAAAYLHGTHPEADHWREVARASLKRFATYQPADGSFDEGISYWTFTFSHYIFSLEILRRKTGVDDSALLPFPAMARYTLDMRMPTASNPIDAIDIGDATTSAEAVGLAWIARNFRDSVAQYQVLQPQSVRSYYLLYIVWGAIWFDPSVPAALPADMPLDHRYPLGYVVSRSGWTSTDGVLVFRSGEGTNHEHADRNGLLFTAHGERLLNDPLKAAYSTKDPKWLLRQTAAHTSILIDGHGHFYHDGSKGTNATLARAEIQAYQTGPDWMLATSEALDAYQRASLPVSRVQRTVLFLKPDIVLILDRIVLTEKRSVQARFQVFNDDGAGRVSATKDTFLIERPAASLLGRTWVEGGHDLATGRLALPEKDGVYPYAEVTSPAATAHTLLTVCTAAPKGDEHGHITLERSSPALWKIAGNHRGRTVAVTLQLDAALPKIVL